MSMAPSSSAAAAARVSLVLSLLIFASSISVSSSSASPHDRLEISDSAARRRAILAHLAAAAAAAAGAECRELGSREECARSTRRCRWCRSDAIDDMCFGSAEAWRLPHQVFSCDPIPVAAAS